MFTTENTDLEIAERRIGDHLEAFDLQTRLARTLDLQQLTKAGCIK
jgi:hypothetical protein